MMNYFYEICYFGIEGFSKPMNMKAYKLKDAFIFEITSSDPRIYKNLYQNS